MLSFPPCRNPRRRTQDSFGLWALKKQWRSRSVLHLLAHLFASLLLTWMPSSGPLQLQVGHRVQVEVQEREEEWARGVVGKEDIEDVEGRAAQGEQAELRMGTEGVPCSRSSEEGMAVRTVREEDIQAEEAIQEALPWDTGPSGVHTAAQESLLGGAGGPGGPGGPGGSGAPGGGAPGGRGGWAAPALFGSISWFSASSTPSIPTTSKPN
mmetsp:Transcript_44348/g.139932  ORF Transcript_44348/g.139932 Transcript_44348/m.139932 type:complete len:210 (-) Transcript_44348:240-869(-)